RRGARGHGRARDCRSRSRARDPLDDRPGARQRPRADRGQGARERPARRRRAVAGFRLRRGPRGFARPRRRGGDAVTEGTLARACAEVDGRLQGADAAFHGISTDSRRVQPRELFFALRGPSFDGADFVPQAAAAGAAGAVVARPVTADLPVIEVDDTRRALGALAAAWRRRMPARVIGLTGTNGKTTLKEMIASCLGTSAPTLATRGNLNNDVGVPLMLAELEDTHRYAVIEMG